MMTPFLSLFGAERVVFSRNITLMLLNLFVDYTSDYISHFEEEIAFTF